MKKIVFYQPICETSINNINSGTLVRPRRMKCAFSNIGYEIIDINGTFENRSKKVLDALKEDIKFTYIESVNIPLFLSCRSENKISFFSDIKNIKKLKKKTKIGYYYRDNFWTESSYFKKVGFIKGVILRICFFFEYLILIRLVDVMFVQSKEMIESFPFSNKYKNKFKLLPPGCEEYNIDQFEYNTNAFNILYSGACDDYSKYNIFPLLSAINQLDKTNIYINSNFVEELFNRYPEYNKSNNIIKMDIKYDDIDKHTQKYNVGIMYLNDKNKNIKKYLPIKIFYYMSLGLPILAQENTAAGDFIKNNNIGWIYRNLEDLKQIINDLKNNPTELNEKHSNVLACRNNQRWIDRAKYVEDTLI